MILYYITNRTQFEGSEAARQERLLECVTGAAEAGVDYIQLREKDLATEALEALAQATMERVREAGTNTRLLINSRVAVAATVGADGVHLPAHGADIAAAKDFCGGCGMKSPVIGISCHTIEEAVSARTKGADFAVFGPVFEKPGLEKKDSPGAGLARLRDACAAVAGWPVLALGGVTTDNAGECMRAGATGVAGIRLFQTGELARTVAALRGR